MNYEHNSVLLNEAIDFLNIQDRDGIWVDATLGLGGHSEAILKKITPGSLLIGIDRNGESVEIAAGRLRPHKNFITAHSNFRHMDVVFKQNNVNEIDGIIFDLGFSSFQIEKPGRGFSFMTDEKPDMRMDGEQELTADYVINNYSEKELDRIIKEYGEDRNHRKLARIIVNSRPIKSTKQLAELAVRINRNERRIHPATRLFQAIRIEVNDELNSLKEGIEKALKFSGKGARIVVISFHSLEDKIVKQFFSLESKDCICENKRFPCTCGHKKVLKIITKKPVVAKEKEQEENRRARSARLRAAEKI
jgi:16S rRNA (cytosine1402-N4)-methyltransferase